MLRHKADIKTIFYMILTTGLLVYLWTADDLSGWKWGVLYTLQLLLAVSVAVIAHNHNHVNMWKSKFLNILQDNWITVFYGFPAWAWIPTHNKNHHRHTNTEPDYTKTWRYWEANNILTLISYPSISGKFQQPAWMQYMKTQYQHHRRTFWLCMLQVFSLVAWIGVGLAVDWYKALLYIIIPQQFALFAVLIFNYVQHIHADEMSEWNHSRNITGWLLNFYLFNNGYHTAHHIKPATHWSELPAEHAKIHDKIDPKLNEYSFMWYIIRVYILGIFVPQFRTHNMRMERINKEKTLQNSVPSASVHG